MAASTTTETTKKMTYVRLGSSGLTISRIILGCMSYGSAEYQPWILPEEEGISHIKAAYVKL
jgi:aryl-alcohol dehydrogenase-like predicted oxidoreductase